MAGDRVSKQALGDEMLDVFYDGDCPLCRREVQLLRRRDGGRRLRWINIAAPDFEANRWGVTQERLMAEIHARRGDGEWIRGVDVFRELYTAVGWGWLVAISRWPGMAPLLEAAYRIFARNRLRWTGRCSESCAARVS